MYVSRSESHNQNKKRRKLRFRKLFILNLAMLLVILVIGSFIIYANGGLFTGGSDRKAENTSQTATQNNGQTQSSVNDGSAADPNTDGTNAGSSEVDKTGTDQNHTPTDNNNAGTNDSAGSADSVPNSNEGNEGIIPVSGNSSETIKLAFVGDILLAGSVDKLMLKSGYDFPYAKALPLLQTPDFTAGNLETPITTRGLPAENKQYVFKGDPDSLPSLKQAGFDVVSLANNHTLDQGPEGLLDTINHLDQAGISHIGGGKNEEEAFSPVILEAKGIKVAYLGFSRVVPDGSWKAIGNHTGVAATYDSRKAAEAIKKAHKVADLVVVFVHWGVERQDTPVEHQSSLARDYIDAGADLVIGAHPHVLQGFEQYKGKWIAYSLGNFVFNMTQSEKTSETGVLDALCSKNGVCSLQLHPMKAALSQPSPLEGAEAQALLRRISSISINAAIDTDGKITARK